MSDEPRFKITIVPGVTKPIKVANVLSRESVVLNVGSEDGVTLSTIFLIYGEGPEVIDPDTGESLGNLEMVRGKAKVKHLQNRMCTVDSINTRTIPGSKKVIRPVDSRGIRNVFSHNMTIEEVEEGARTIDLPFDGVQVGDRARYL